MKIISWVFLTRSAPQQALWGTRLNTVNQLVWVFHCLLKLNKTFMVNLYSFIKSWRSDTGNSSSSRLFAWPEWKPYTWWIDWLRGSRYRIPEYFQWKPFRQPLGHCICLAASLHCFISSPLSLLPSFSEDVFLWVQRTVAADYSPALWCHSFEVLFRVLDRATEGWVHWKRAFLYSCRLIMSLSIESDAMFSYKYCAGNK